jgi:hypothetical protein
MILFPLMTAWMWLQLFTASPLPSLRCSVKDISNADVPSPPSSQCH